MVRFTVVFHGRENQHKDIGIQILNDTAKRLAELANVDGGLQAMGNRMSMTFVPKTKQIFRSFLQLTAHGA